MSIWEIVAIAAFAALIVFWFRRSVPAAMEESRRAKKDWKAVIIPLGAVVLFVILLMSMV